MTQALPKKRYTVQEYYALEREAEYKSDYYKGEIFAMAGGTIRHSTICSNLVREVGNRLKGKPCRAYEANLRLKNNATGLRNYADVTAFCEPFEYDDEDPNHETVTNPTAIFEVLSPSTENYDRGFKGEGYRRMASLKAYILVTQDRPYVEIYERQPTGGWLLREETSLDAAVSITSLGIELPMTEIYDGVKFGEGETPSS